MTVRVVVVEDNDVFREALVLLLGRQPDVEVVGDVAGGEEAVELCRREAPDVVLLDYRLPGMDGVQTTAALKAVAPSAAVVCLTASATLREEEAFVAAGAVTVLTKDAPLDEIADAIVKAAPAPAPR
ncbi:MAG TPA: response regulator transcription factor [Gaiellaceae bacterium]|nr:response regulator transcription factor [Gaiellaceae bacterium]